jgi:hypothetical protein
VQVREGMRSPLTCGPSLRLPTGYIVFFVLVFLNYCIEKRSQKTCSTVRKKLKNLEIVNNKKKTFSENIVKMRGYSFEL